MLRTVAAALVAAGALSVPAHADPPNDTQFLGRCHLAAVLDPEGTFQGELDAVVVAVSPTPAHDPVRMLSIECVIRVNGTPVLSAPGTVAGPAGIVPPTPVSSTVGDDQWVELCTVTTAVDAHGQQVQRGCAGPHGDPNLWTLLDPLLYEVDVVACSAFTALAPTQVRNDLRIEEDGDVYVAGELWWDCPPYGS